MLVRPGPRYKDVTKMSRGSLWPFYLCAIGALALVAVTLDYWGATEIRENITEVFFLTFLAAVWLMFMTKLFPWLGLKLRDDVAERKNRATLIALCGAVLALGFICAGANIGEGPSFTNNFFC